MIPVFALLLIAHAAYAGELSDVVVLGEDDGDGAVHAESDVETFCANHAHELRDKPCVSVRREGNACVTDLDATCFELRKYEQACAERLANTPGKEHCTVISFDLDAKKCKFTCNRPADEGRGGFWGHAVQTLQSTWDVAAAQLARLGIE